MATSKQHKSISASDVLRALEQMDMGDIVPKLQGELDSVYLLSSHELMNSNMTLSLPQ